MQRKPPCDADGKRKNSGDKKALEFQRSSNNTPKLIPMYNYEWL